jgi:hypothetical protein
MPAIFDRGLIFSPCFRGFNRGESPGAGVQPARDVARRTRRVAESPPLTVTGTVKTISETAPPIGGRIACDR